MGVHGAMSGVIFDPDRSMELAGRAAALTITIALTVNTLLVAVSPQNSFFEYCIVVTSAISAAGLLLHMMMPSHRAGLIAALVSAGVWAASFLEGAVVHPEGVALALVVRQCGFYLAFFVGSVSLYYVEKLHLRRLAASRQQDVRASSLTE